MTPEQRVALEYRWTVTEVSNGAAHAWKDLEARRVEILRLRAILASAPAEPDVADRRLRLLHLAMRWVPHTAHCYDAIDNELAGMRADQLAAAMSAERDAATRRADAVEPSLDGELRRVLNSFSAENGSNTPDYILRDYLLG